MRRVLDPVRAEVSAWCSEAFIRGVSAAFLLHPLSRPEAHGVEVLRDLPYLASGHEMHRLDVYRPVARPGPWPIVFYVHGGGFRLLSKDTHWVMGLVFARHGYLVVNISYRLAPRHPFPCAMEDTCAAWAWLVEHAASLGGDLGRVAVAGESAGGNLVTSLTLATCQRRDEPWARLAYDTGVTPGAVMPFCSILEVSHPERFAGAAPWFVTAMIRDIASWYLGTADHGAALDLANPLTALERGLALSRPLPPFFAPVGTWDPLAADHRRLESALARLGVPCEARYYRGGIHAFHAMVWNPTARRCWRDALAFLDRHLRESA